MTEHPPQLRDLPPEEKKRLAYIEGREDLFETKVLEMESSSDIEERVQKKKNVLIISCDPGSANALSPVMELLRSDDALAMRAMVDGRAGEILREKFPMKDITPANMALGADSVLGTPDVLLIDPSFSESGIETYAVATFPEVPTVVLEDYYTSSFNLLQRLKERKMPYPKKICVMDGEAKKLIVKEFPELEERIEITGQPSFDRFATEDTERIKIETRKELGLADDEKLLTFILAGTTIQLVERLAEELKKVAGKFRLAFGIHPRDNTPPEVYEKIFKNVGVPFINAELVGISRVGAASDVVLLIVSTEGLNAIYRRKPTLHITDPEFVKAQKDLDPPPPVKLGASIELDDMDGLAATVERLFDPESRENIELKKRMEENYPVDGKNAERVVNILKAEIA
ncbi:MAG TPA: hypothetical protein VJI70_02865 [Candidatus Paceibacterota bacterium]